jgi:hypothetical protein
MKNKGKKAASFVTNPRSTLAHPRKAIENKGKTAKRPTGSPTAADKRRTVTDRGGVTRVLDSVEQMFRSGQIDGRQRAAAERMRAAAALLSGSIPCALDVTRIAGAGGPTSPTEAQFAAGRVLASARKNLGKIDYGVVGMVCCDGHSIAEVAAFVFCKAGGKPSARQTDHIGQRLRMALDALAEGWYPAPKARIRAQGVDASVFAANEGESYAIERGRVVHATGWRYFEV